MWGNRHDPTPRKITLRGFNNLTKTLGLNLYEVAYARSELERQAWHELVQRTYNSGRLGDIMTAVAERIGATVLNVSGQDYEPQGASVNLLIAEGPIPAEGSTGIREQALLAHLDKSHISVHTYPESHPHNGIHTVRLDVEVSTCGEVSPLHALPELLSCFDADVASIDYRVRGFTRSSDGERVFMDHAFASIQHHLGTEVASRYDMVDSNFPQQHFFHTRLRVRDIDPDVYLLVAGERTLGRTELERIRELVSREIDEIFTGPA